MYILERKRLLLACIFLISIINCKLEWQEGEDNQIQAGKEHLLESSTEYPREMTVKVNFEKEFEKLPKVALGLVDIQWGEGQGQGFKVKLGEVTTKGFAYRSIVYSEIPLQSITVKWVAFVDPHIQIDTQEYKVFNINGNSNKSSSVFSYDFERTLNEPPRVGVFLLGGQWNKDGSTYDVRVDAKSISEKGCELEISTYQDGNPYSVYMQLLIVPQERGQLFQKGGLKENGGLKYFKARAEDVKFQKTEMVVDPQYVQNGGFMFWGLSGFASGVQQSFKVFLRNPRYKEVSGKFDIYLGSYQNNQLTNANFDLIAYQPKDDCAFLFSGCNFTGNGISICKNIDQNSFSGTHLQDNQIRSIYIPEGETLTLFEKENLQGRTATFDQSQECLEKLVADQE